MLQGCTVVQPQVVVPKQAFTVLADSLDNRSVIDLGGVWEFQREGIDTLPEKAHKISIPANWFTQKLDGQAKETNIDFHGKAVHTTTFRIPNNDPKAAYTLVFEGVDYEADVWLNEQYLGKHTGYFAPFSFDARGIVRLGGQENMLKVVVNSPQERAEDWSLHKRLIKGIFGHHDTRPGNAWSRRGQEQNTGGIWGKVFLVASNSAAFRNMLLEPRLAGKQAFVRISTHIFSHAETPVKARLHWSLSPYNFRDSASFARDTQTVVLQHGENLISHEIEVQHPHLWYSRDVGEPHLYTLSSRLSDSAGTTLDERHDRTGLRSIVCDAKTNIWYLNGHRIFLRGTNYIGTQWLSTMRRADYDKDIAMMQAANINAIRIHAHISAKSFYQACDEAGIMVWQDFPLQWGYADDADFVREATKQVKEMTIALHNHPSIIAWSLHNEPPFDADWMVYKYKDYDAKQNKTLNAVLTKTAQNNDSTRYVHPFSATKEHHWQGWYGGSWRDHTKPTKSTMITEFGAQALPVKATLKTIFPEHRLFPRTEEDWADWDFHNFQKMETFQNAKVPMGMTTDEFIQNTQEYQTRLTKLAAESYRRQKYAPVGSVFQFMFVENWASVNWGIVDYLRVPKPAYFALQEAYKPVTAFADYDAVRHEVRLWAINDTWKDVPKATVICALQPKLANGQIAVQSQKFEKMWSCKMPADSVYLLDSWQLPASVSRTAFEKMYNVVTKVITQ